MSKSLHTRTNRINPVQRNITKASQVFGAIRNLLTSKYVSLRAKAKTFRGGIVSILLFGSETWRITVKDLRSLTCFYNSCVRQMTRVTMAQVKKHRISTDALLKRVQLPTLFTLLASQVLGFIGRIIRGPKSRPTRQILTANVRAPRCPGGQVITFGRTVQR